MHALGFAWYSSGSLGAALDRLDRYHRMLSTALDWTTEVDTETRRLKVVVAPGLDLRDEVIDAAFAWIVLQCRQLCGDDFSPRRVEMTRPTPEPVQPFLDYFRTQIDFGTDENILHFNIEGLSDPLVSANEELAAECDAIVERYLARFDREDYALQVRVKISELLPSGAVSEGAVAKSLHVSLRNLQRKLSAQDTKYKDILDETRHTLALQYLGHSSISVTETAFLLGFENPSNFTRAFKRWTGSTPTQHINYPG
jgi:AraC-like DNA-binding protein